MTLNPTLNDNYIRPVFVVGVPRSGTTVLAKKLAEVTGRVMVPETHFMPEVWGKLRHLNLADEVSATQAVTQFELGRWFPDLGLEKGVILEQFLKSEDKNWPTLFRCILDLHARCHGKRLLGEKTPGHYRHVSTLLDWYPDCRILFLLRDPRAVVASNIRAPFAPSFAWFSARRWSEVISVYQAHKHDPRVELLRYEDFVANPDVVLNDLAKQYGRDELKGSKRVAPVAPQTEWRSAHLKAARNPVSQKNIGKWRQQLSDYEIWQVEAETGHEMQIFGYDPVISEARANGFGACFKRDYPRQRLELSLIGAFNGGTGSKSAALRLLGNIIDRVRKDDPEGRAAFPKVTFSLPEDVMATSSFAKPPADIERYGLMLSELNALPCNLEIIVRNRNGLMAASALKRFFGLKGSTRVVRNHTMLGMALHLSTNPSTVIPIITDLRVLTQKQVRSHAAEFAKNLECHP